MTFLIKRNRNHGQHDGQRQSSLLKFVCLVTFSSFLLSQHGITMSTSNQYYGWFVMGFSPKTSFVTPVSVPLPSSSFSTTRRTQLFSSSSQNTQNFNLDQEEERAGQSGYSVLRQPVKWDPDSDPSFDVPTTLQDDTNSIGSTTTKLDESWLEERRGNAKNSRQQSQTKKNNNEFLPKQTKQKKHLDHLGEVGDELNLFQRTLETLDYPMILQALSSQCVTVPGREIVDGRSWPMNNVEQQKRMKKQKKKTNVNKSTTLLKAFEPLTAESPEGIQERYGAVREMQYLMNIAMLESWEADDSSNNLKDAYWRNRKGYKESLGPPPFKGMSFNLQSIFEIADNGQVLEGPDIYDVSTMLDVMEDLTLWSKGLRKASTAINNKNNDKEQQELSSSSNILVDYHHLADIGDCITVNATLQELLENAFEKGGRLSGTTFPQIGMLRAKVRTLKRDILGTLDELITAPSMQSKLATESGGATYAEINGRIVIPIDPKANNKASLGIVHDSSRSGRTVYVEPTEIVGPTNDLRQAEGELRQEEARVWRLLTEEILQNRMILEESVYAVGQLDLVMARVLLGERLEGVIPYVGNEGTVSLRDAKHPVLLLRDLENVVGSDIDIGADGNQGLVLTGPNSGGKTVILKLLGLVALMARNGIPVPANAKNADHTPRVDFFDPVLADIGDLQSVDGDLSTFSGHMLVCREVLANSGENALVLMDELGSGTDPNQGVAIAQALLEALLDTGARCAITTHYMALKQLAASDDRFSVGGMQFIGGRPTYKLLPGTVGESFALAVAERLQLPESVLTRANELLDQETRQMGDLIRELEDQKALVDEQVEELAQRKRDMAAMEAQMRGQQKKLESKQLSARRDEAKKFAAKLEEKERVLEEILEKLKSDPSRKVVASSWNDVKFVKRDALNEAENVPSVMAAKREAAAVQTEAASQLVPLAELRDKPDLKVGDELMVCKKGPLFGKKATISQLGNRIQVKVNGMVVQMKMTELALPVSGLSSSSTGRVGGAKGKQAGPKDLSKAAQKAIQAEQNLSQQTPLSTGTTKGSKSTSIRTESNTIDVRGCYMEQARSKCMDKFSRSLTMGRNVVYILHGHGTGGVLKTKVRQWLRSERKIVKSFSPADQADGGDAFTKVVLKSPNT